MHSGARCQGCFSFEPSRAAAPFGVAASPAGPAADDDGRSVRCSGRTRARTAPQGDTDENAEMLKLLFADRAFVAKHKVVSINSFMRDTVH